MTSINLGNYTVVIQVEGERREVPYEVRPSLVNLLFAQQNLTAMDILDRDDLGRKIRDHAGEMMALEEAEFKMLEHAVKTFKGFGQHDVELVRRIMLAAPQ